MPATYPIRKERGPNGRPLCRVCGVEVPKGHRTCCGQEHCLHTLAWNIALRKVHKRDKGVCAHCGFDTDKFMRVLRWIGRWERTYGVATFITDRTAGREIMRELGLRAFTSLWQADHIHERVRGGNNTLANLRTLCLACHKIETKRLAGERAIERREAKATLFSGRL